MNWSKNLSVTINTRMSQNPSPRLPKWSLFLLLYVLVLVASFLTSRTTHSSFNVEVIPSKIEKSLVLIFSDPLLPQPELFDALTQQYTVVNGDFAPQSFFKNAFETQKRLDSLHLRPTHIVGIGVGGSIAMHFARIEADTSQSLTLINANGVEELELLGGYHLNHTAYRLKKVWYCFLKYGIPHFGNFENLDDRLLRLNIQINSDQRLIRDILGEIDNPALIVHTASSRVLREVSEEHHRLLPQSEFLEIESGDNLIPDVLKFLAQSDSKGGITRSEADQTAIMESLKPFDPKNGIRAEGWMLFLLMIVIILSTMVSEDLTCIGTGLMVARGLIGFVPGTVACLMGIFIGDILIFVAGRWLAGERLQQAPLKWFISEKDIQMSSLWFEAKGPAIIIASRFIPGSRFPTYFAAGAIRANFSVFMLYFGLASVIWTPMLVGLSTLLGQKMMDYFTLYQEYALWVLLGVLSILYAVFKIIIPSFTYKGRRQLVGKWKRLTNWEYWSPFVVYTPVFLYSSFLWIKYRSITLVTLVNPGIKDGGFIKESKSEILDRITARETVARYKLIPSSKRMDERVEKVLRFMEELHLSFPIVVKPDIGERGKGVVIPKNLAELKIVLQKNKEDVIVQEYIPGEEFGIFYYRFPNEESGHIFSITRKEYQYLNGDGKHTLEHQILQHPRAVCLAEKHFEEHLDDLYRIIPKDKEYKLVEVGTHARGSIFSDAMYLNTAHLEKEIDRISKSFEGFYFGRYDIKVPSETHLKEGSDLKVLELNGVTSEATHIYDAKFNAVMGIRTLMRQWRLAYEIAAQVQDKNPELKPPTVRYILELLG